MGTYRLLLALSVLYSHVFGGVFGWNTGVVAVISFFVISGYVMTLLVTKHYPRLVDAPAFYADRAMRLFPQYLVYLGATLVLLQFSHVVDVPRTQGLDVPALFANILMLPLNFYFALGLEDAMLVPPAWSLGLELTFYLVLPFFFAAAIKARAVVVGLSLLVFSAAWLRLLHTDWFGYRLLPGTFFMFFAGICVASEGRWRLAAVGIWVGAIVALGITFITPSLMAASYNKEVLAGIVIGVPAVWFLGRLRFTRWDEALGNLSYGVFLNHTLVMWVFDHFGVDRLAVPVASMALAGATYLAVERPAIVLRRRLRGTSYTARPSRLSQPRYLGSV